MSWGMPFCSFHNSWLGRGLHIRCRCAVIAYLLLLQCGYCALQPLHYEGGGLSRAVHPDVACGCHHMALSYKKKTREKETLSFLPPLSFAKKGTETKHKQVQLLFLAQLYFPPYRNLSHSAEKMHAHMQKHACTRSQHMHVHTHLCSGMQQCFVP